MQTKIFILLILSFQAFGQSPAGKKEEDNEDEVI